MVQNSLFPLVFQEFGNLRTISPGEISPYLRFTFRCDNACVTNLINNTKIIDTTDFILHKSLTCVITYLHTYLHTAKLIHIDLQMKFLLQKTNFLLKQ